MIEDYVGQRVTVMGLGRFGGGVGVTRFLAERGADVLVTDTLPPEELRDSVAQLAEFEKAGQVRFRLGEHNVSDFTTCDLLVVNPAVKPDNRFVRAARAADIPVTSEIRLLVKHLPNRLRTIGITGSAGKSTTTAMTAHILRKVLEQKGETPLGDWAELTPSRQDAETPPPEAPPESLSDIRRQVPGPGVWMGGNIGGSLLPWVESIRDDDWVVLELSSFMLEGLREDEWSPHIAVVTNISPNHVDWHGSMENYVAAKQAILDHQSEDEDCFYFGFGVCEFLTPRVKHLCGWDKWYEFSDEPRLKLEVPGDHNQLNAYLALMTTDTACGINQGHEDERWLEGFRGLPHRLEFAGEFNGVRIYNDSKSTTPDAASLAMEAFETGGIHLIVGGYDKGSDFDGMAKVAAHRCAGVYAIGVTGEKIVDSVNHAWEKLPELPELTDPQPMLRPDPRYRIETYGILKKMIDTVLVWSGRREKQEAKPRIRQRLQPLVVCCGELEAAVRMALSNAKPGEVLVLSPGCASWDQFANYEERGERFVELVKAWAAKQKPTD